jgi:hypothetical protein
MNITNAQFTAKGSINALVDGVQISIPADAGNRHYAAILEQGITPAEYVGPKPVPAEKQVRAERDRLLAATDWMALSDVTMSPEWATYRQALRDVTEQVGFPDNVTWPIAPE